jgi:hypothetical protein
MRPVVCPRCNGKGKSAAIRERDHIFMSWYIWQECPACQGTGYRHGSLDGARNHLAAVAEPFLSFASCLTTTRSETVVSSKDVAFARFKLS